MRKVGRTVGVTVIAVAVSTVLALPSGASTVSRVAAGLPKACTLFTPALAAAALGGPVGPPVATKPNPHETICKYTRTDGFGFGTVEVGPWAFVQPPGGGAKIKGLGDEAVGMDPFGVSVRKGSNGFNVDLALAVGDFSGAAADQQAAANIAADTALAKQLLPAFTGKKKK